MLYLFKLHVFDFGRTLRLNRTPATVYTSCRETRPTVQSAPGCSPSAVKGEANALHAANAIRYIILTVLTFMGCNKLM